MEQLHALAQACGLAREWRNVEGRQQVVSDAALAAVLAALGHDVAGERQIARALADVDAERTRLPAMLVADAGGLIDLPFTPIRAEATGEDAVTRPLVLDGHRLIAPQAPGYYDLALDGRAVRLAVAPAKCPLPARNKGRPWAVAVQIPALRGAQAAPFGGFGELADAARVLGAAGADALAINPVHALFPGHGVGYSPYSPSSRLFLNGALADPVLAGLPPLPEANGPALIDWAAALPARLAQLRAVFAGLSPEMRAKATATDDAMLRRHALFDALDCHFRAASGAHGWRDWPAAFHDPAGEAARRFAAEHPDEVAFHLFVQWLARQGLATAQAAARQAGMGIGLIGDLAVGVDPSGSDVWSLRHAMLDGLTIGAPPDPLGPLGQNWSITGFSPHGLRASGYEPWIAMIRAGLASGGGLRIDHAFGLARLWVIPEGGATGDGAYLSYPFEDLIRLATLEAHRAGAFIIAEDLGTAPHGFTHAVTDRQMLGMRVLWFERAADHGFIGAQDYEALSVAMSGTHDTVTVAGWWKGRDLDWAEELGRLPEGMTRAEAEAIRDWDRGLLWSTLDHTAPRPAPDDPAPVVDAAIGHIAATPSALALVSLEDLLGLEEQPNLPGTITEHPNWRRRLAAPTDALLGDARVQHRCVMLGRSAL
ncbi:4-alpha-glucanotransferase [Porphyrobacter sp. HT-58-2]|uniref:4-alpha-glucanotransferase n=1 Tax=Porphyrobacter sp. HT-58-2 TaxID=2023229 RepID=UPI000CDC3BA1|nr:4-alpha-glucanotransferase [Porphyrobacter sp. HT-58-2]AUX69186.1 4-alpha-glucanotransferase [Porphyrobacter sp. HT-58-2]